MKLKFVIPIITVLGSVFFGCKKHSSPEPAQVSSITASGDSSLVLSYGGLTALIDYAHGGRLEALSLNGQNMLMGKSVNPTNWGTSFWPSPQSAWGWPPSNQLDVYAYTVLQATSPIILKSQRDPKSGYQFIKSYAINTADTTLVIAYGIYNDTSISNSVAPWEISRVASGGLTFYPSGSETKSGALAALTKDSIGITWFKYDTTTIPTSGTPKLLADASVGWLAQVSNGLLMVKSFPNVAAGAEAKGEDEIELYTDPNYTYVEIENQGAYVTIAPEQAISYTVIYKLTKIPSSIPVGVGSAKLAELAKSMYKPQ